MPPLPRLLFLVNDAHYFVTHRAPLAKAAVGAGYEVHVAVPFTIDTVENKPALDIIRQTGARMHNWDMHRADIAVMGELHALWGAWRLVSDIAPDIMHCVTIKPVLYGGAIARLRHRPAIFAISGLGHIFIAEGIKARLIRLIISLGYRFALGNRQSRTIFQNEDDRALFYKLDLVPESQTVLIPGCGVDTGKFHPAPTPPGGLTTIVLPARLQREKGVHEFVAAAEILARRGVKARMALVGYADFDRPGGIDRTQLEQWCSHQMVEWWGHSTDMPATFRNAHIACLPSYREGFPKVLVEAAACGLPVVTTDVPGCRDSVRAGETALLVPVQDAQALADALEKLIADAELRQEMGQAGRKLVETHYSEAQFIERSLALYQEALK